MAEKTLEQLYVEIKVKSDDLEKKLDKISSQSKKSANDIEKGFTKSTSSLKTFALQAIAATGIITLLGAAFKKAIENINGQLDAENKLQNALGFTSQKLKDKASELQKLTKFGDETTLVAFSIIAAFTKEEDQIIELTKAAMDLATAQGIDLNTAAEQVAKTFAGGRSVLRAYGIDIKGAAGSSERLHNITAAISNLWGGRAEADAKTFSGRIVQLNNKIGDLYEQIGLALLPTLESLATAFSGFVEDMQESQGAFNDIGLLIKVTASAFVVLGAAIVFTGKTLGTFLGGFAVFLKNAYKGPLAFQDLAKTLKTGFTDAANTAKDAKNFINKLFEEPIKAKVELKAFNTYDYDKKGNKKGSKKLLFGDESTTTDNAANNAIKNFEQLKTQVEQYDKLLSKSNLTEAQRNILYKERFDLLQKIAELQKSLTPENEALNVINEDIQNADTNTNPLDDFVKSVGSAGNTGAPSNQKSKAEEASFAITESGKKFEESINTALTSAQNISSILGIGADTFISKLLSGLEQGISLANSIFSLISAFAGGGPAGGILGIIGSLFGKNGGTFANNRKISSFANGGSFTVPNYYPNDSFLMRVQSGEKINVSRFGQINDTDKLLRQLIGSVEANSKTVALNSLKSINIPDIYVDGEKITRKIKSKENRLNKNGVNLDVL